jgi:predicted lipoprotein with Yx(FWY)xxD motif
MNRSLTALPKIAAALVVAVLIAAVAGCGSSNSESEGSETSAYGGTTTEASSKSSAAPAASSGAATVSVGSVPKEGRVLVDSGGLTLYDFHKDKGTQSSCYGACAATWPPLTTEGSPKASEGAMTSKLGTTKRSDGSMQVTYAGHPLYTYAADQKPGEANGNDIDSFGGEWYVLQPNGQEP